MKHILIVFALACAWQSWGQVELPRPGDVDKEYRKEFKQAVREYNRTEKRLKDWDVVLGPGESVPTDVISAEEFRAQSYSNWFRDLVSPASVAEDMVAGAARKGVVVITDTGCDTNHPDLQVGKIKGSNYTADPCPDVYGHATHVDGIAYLIMKPLIEAGFIEVKMAKFLGDQGQGSYAAITGGVNEETAFLVDNYLNYGRFAIANASWGGGTSTYSPLSNALQSSKDKGVAWFFAAGNSGGAVIFPGLLPQVNAISSLDDNLAISSFSCRGPEVDFAAGGRNIYSTHLNGNYASLSGTSMATPAMAALGAVAMCLHHSLTSETLPRYLADISQDLGGDGKDDLYGWGMAFARKIIDTPPGGVPPPATCTDGKQNGKETGVDCGGPDCPACAPPPEPGKPPYRYRVIPVALDGSWVLRWVVSNSLAKKVPTAKEAEKAGVNVTPDGALHSLAVDCYDMDTYRAFQVQGMTNIKIERMVFEVESETTLVWEYATLLENADKFFRNSSIGTPSNWDVYDAGRYIMYFFDYYLSNEFKGYTTQNIKPVGVVFEWEGVHVEIGRDLVDYQKK